MTRLEDRVFNGIDRHLAGELVCCSDRENLIVLAGPANRDHAFQRNEEGHIGLRGFIRERYQLVSTVMGRRIGCGLFVPHSTGRLPTVRVSKGHQATPLHLYVNFRRAQNRNPSANINM